jgi:hypothetical protein
VPRNVEVGLVEQRPHRLPLDDPHLPRVLLDALDRADGVGLRRRQQLLEAAPERIGAAERVRRAHDREQVVPPVEALERVCDPDDVRRGGRGVLGRP